MKKAQAQTLAWISGFAGIGLLILGGSVYLRRRGALNGPRQGQAPAIGGYSDGRMKTTLRSSRNMPIEQRIATIQDLVHKSVQDPEMRKTALHATSRCPERDQMCEAKAIYHYVKNRVRYTGDIGPIKHPDGTVEGVDLYQSARRTLEFGGGDCDDNAILVATLAGLNGLTAVLRVVRQRSDSDWSHIYAGIVGPNGKFVAIDTTLPGSARFGIEAPFSKHVDFPA